MEAIQHIVKSQQDWQTNVNQVIDALTEIGGGTKLQLSAPSRDGLVLLDGAEYDGSETDTYYQTVSFENWTLVIFTYSLKNPSLTGQTNQTRLVQLPDSILPATHQTGIQVGFNSDGTPWAIYSQIGTDGVLWVASQTKLQSFSGYNNCSFIYIHKN